MEKITKGITLEDAIRRIYETMFTVNKCISVFSSLTLQGLAETVEAIQIGQEHKEAETQMMFNIKNEVTYNLAFSIMSLGEEYRDYVIHNFKNDNISVNTKVFRSYLYPIFLESLINSAYAVLSTDGIEVFTEAVANTIEIGNNQFLNIYALRNNNETFEDQVNFITREIEDAINNNYDFIVRLENFNFNEMKDEFLGWTDKFPERIASYVLSLHNYAETRYLDSNEIEQIERIENDLIDIAYNASILAVTIERA